MDTQSGPRHWLPLALTIVATVLAFLAIFAVWANRQLLDTDNWTESSSELLENEDIRAQISGFLVDELYANVDVRGQLEEALPPRAAPLAGPAAGGLRELAERGTTRLLGRPRVQERWEQANRRAHKLLLAAVEGDSEVLDTTDGKVTLDLKALLTQTQNNAGVGGRVASKLPADAAQITIMKSDELGLAQDLVRFFERLLVVLVVGSLGLFALAVFLARGRRREALRGCGVGFVVAGGGVLLARELAGGLVVDALTSTESVRPAAEATWSIGTSLLSEAAWAMVGYGVVLLAAAWVAGPSDAAVGLRRVLAPYLREPRFAYGGLAVVVALVLAWGPTPATRKVLPALILIAVLVLGVEALRRQTAREHPLGAG